MAWSFLPGSSAVLNRIAVLSSSDRDFSGFFEDYDLYYSDADGTPNPDGMYLTIDGLFPFTNDAGYNIAEVGLKISGAVELANQYTRVNALGALPNPGTADLAIDGDLDTHTFLGDSTDQDNRLSMTFGFAASVPEPSPAVLAGAGLALVAAFRRRRSMQAQVPGAVAAGR